MNSSLRDQLLAAGLVTEQQARKAAQQEQQRQFRNRGKPPGPGTRPPGKPNTAHPNSSHPGRGNPNAGGRPNAATPAQPPVNALFEPQAASPTLLAQQAQAAKVARDLELNRKREEKAKRRARLAQIEQIIEQNRAPRLETEDYYSFLDGKKIRRMAVNPERREKLTRGELVIVRYKGHYAVVPAETADRVRERDENMVVKLVQPTGSEVDEAYKDFVVPDDLMW